MKKMRIITLLFLVLIFSELQCMGHATKRKGLLENRAQGKEIV